VPVDPSASRKRECHDRRLKPGRSGIRGHVPTFRCVDIPKSA
jgi:hypothetical protein